MPAQIIDGKAAAAEVREGLKADVAAFIQATGVTPGLEVVLLGEDPASQVYTRSKAKTCAEVGMRSKLHELPAATTQAELLALIARLSADPLVHGILVQLPLPGHIDERTILLAVPAEKDVDCFHPTNVGRLWTDQPGFAPCTPFGCLHLIKRTGVALSGKHAVVIGRSNIVGKPMASLLLKESCTVSIAHSKTADLAGLCRQADILVAAVGRRNIVTAGMVKPGAVVIDVGTNRNEAGKLCGDVDFERVKEVAGWITPVPGGVGPMTIAMLLKNALVAAKMQQAKEAGR